MRNAHIFVLLLTTTVALYAEENSDIVAPTDSGREIVIKPLVEKLKEHGLTPDKFRSLCEYHRFFGDLDFEFEGKRIALKSVADVTVRELQAPPFTVSLPDGREAAITPDPKAIARYMVAGHFFERTVRQALSNPFLQDPTKVTVLGGIPVPGGGVPNAWGEDYVHISIGESLDTFARVEISGNKGPQAAELDRMRSIRKVLNETVNREIGVTRETFEKAFGAGKEQAIEPDKHFKVTPGWEFLLGRGRLTVWYDELNRARSISAYSGPMQESEPRNYLTEARTKAALDFEFLREFVKLKFAKLDVEDQKKLSEFLKAGRSWTDDEWQNLVGDK